MSYLQHSCFICIELNAVRCINTNIRMAQWLNNTIFTIRRTYTNPRLKVSLGMWDKCDHCRSNFIFGPPTKHAMVWMRILYVWLLIVCNGFHLFAPFIFYARRFLIHLIVNFIVIGSSFDITRSFSISYSNHTYIHHLNVNLRMFFFFIEFTWSYKKMWKKAWIPCAPDTHSIQYIPNWNNGTTLKPFDKNSVDSHQNAEGKNPTQHCFKHFAFHAFSHLALALDTLSPASNDVQIEVN